MIPLIAELSTKADLSEIEDQIATADVGDGDQLLDICASILNVLKDLNKRRKSKRGLTVWPK